MKNENSLLHVKHAQDINFIIIRFNFGWFWLSKIIILIITSAPLKYKVEILNEKSVWEEIDYHDGNTFVDGTPAILTFPISIDKQKETNSIRLTQMGPNSHGKDFLAIDSIEFYGTLQ